jgi:hypothetical protein
MPYQILNADGTLLLTLADDVIDTSTTSLSLLGKDASGYGQYIADNFVQLLENFASPNPPNSPQAGQLWYNKGSSLLSVYNSSTWIPLATQAWVSSQNYVLQSTLTNFASQSFVLQQVAANIVNTALTGTPTAPTASLGTNSSQIATTAFVTSSINLINVNHTLTITGDVTGTTPYGTANESFALTLAPSGVTPGTYNSVVVNSKGLVISGSVTNTGGGSGGGTTFTTPVQFDNSTNVATTAFVQRALGNYSNYVNVNSQGTIVTSQLGSSIAINSTTNNSYITTIPEAVNASTFLSFYNNSTVNQQIQTTNSKFYGPNGSGTTTFTIYPNEVIDVVANGTNWIVKLNKMRTSAGPSVWNYSASTVQPTYVWGTNDGINMNIYNPSNLNVATVSSIAWNNVIGKPTDLSYFTNGPGYIAGGVRTAAGIAVGSPTGNCGNCGGVATGNCTTYLTLNTTGSFSMTYDVVNCTTPTDCSNCG